MSELSLDEFLALPEPEGYRLEVTRGRVVREPGPATRHGRIQVRLAAALYAFEERTGAGMAVDSAAFVLATDPPTVRVPDLSFVVRERVPPAGYPAGIWRLAPDLAVEILSPTNAVAEIESKIVDYLEYGVRLIWIIDAHARSATVYRPGRDPLVVRDPDALDGEEILRGLVVPLAGLFLP